MVGPAVARAKPRTFQMLTDGDTLLLTQSEPTDLIESASRALPAHEQVALAERP
jgi:hypothetical protein